MNSVASIVKGDSPLAQWDYRNVSIPSIVKGDSPISLTGLYEQYT